MSEHDGRKPPAAWLRQLREAGHWDRLIELAGQSLAVDPNDVDTHRHIAWAYAASNRPAHMKPHVDFLLQAEPDSTSTHHLAAVQHLDLQRHKQARPHIETLLRLEPQSATYHYLACLLALRENKTPIARAHIQQARQLAPDWVAAAHLEIRMDGIHKRKAREAWERIRRLEDALSLDPQNASVHTTIGEIFLAELELPRDAEKFFRQALLIDPMNKDRQARLLDSIRARSLLYRTLSLPMSAVRSLLKSFRERRTSPFLLIFLIKPLCAFFVWVFVVGAFFTPAAFVYEWFVVAEIRRLRPLPRWLRPLTIPMAWPLWVRMSICSTLIAGTWLLVLTQLVRLPLKETATFVGLLFAAHFLLVALFVGLRRLRTRIGRWQDQRRQATSAKMEAQCTAA